MRTYGPRQKLPSPRDHCHPGVGTHETYLFSTLGAVLLHGWNPRDKAPYIAFFRETN